MKWDIICSIEKKSSDDFQTDDASVDASGGVGVRGSRKKWTTSARLFKRNSNVTVVKTYHIYNILWYNLIVIRIIVYTFLYKWLCLACSWTNIILSSAYQRLWQTILYATYSRYYMTFATKKEKNRLLATRSFLQSRVEIHCVRFHLEVVNTQNLKKKKRLYSVVSFTH